MCFKNWLKPSVRSILFQKWFWPFTVEMYCSCDLKHMSWSLEKLFLIVSRNNFGNKIPILKNITSPPWIQNFKAVVVCFLEQHGTFMYQQNKQIWNRFPRKKSVNNFCGFSIPWGDPSIFCVLEFQRNFSEHFSMQTQSLEHIVSYALFRSHENLRIVLKLFSKTQKQFWLFYPKIFPSKVI